MIDRKDLKKMSKARLKDAEVLLLGKRYDGAVYICGYAVETALKAKVCRTLKWQEFPESRKEFTNLKSFKTHNLDVLLLLSGVETKIKSQYLIDWSIVTQWDPEVRYKPIGSAKKSDVQDMIKATKSLMKIL